MNLMISFFMLLTTMAPPSFFGKSYIIYDAINDVVVECYKERHVQSVASISKVMTAILVIENCELDRIVKIDETINKAYGSCVYLRVGDKISIQDLLYGLMLRSGNDCALMLAASCSGSVDKFVEQMNKKAKELKMYDTTFSNPSGLDEEDEGNLSTVYDMAILYDYCRNNPIFNKIVSTKEYKRQDGLGYWHNKNKLLVNYKYCVGGKTGFTKKAKRTLITNARKGNNEFIIVTFNCGNDFEFHQLLYDYYFNQYNKRILFDRGLHCIEGHKFLFIEPFSIYANIYNEVSFCLIEDKLAVYKDGVFYTSKALIPYDFCKAMKIIMRDLIYG